MVEELNKIADLNINPKDLSSEEVNTYLKEACKKFDIKCAPPETTARLLDKVNFFLSSFEISTYTYAHMWYYVVLCYIDAFLPFKMESFEVLMV